MYDEEYKIISPDEWTRRRDGMTRNYDINGHCFECGSTVHGPQRGQHNNFHGNYIHRAEVKDGFAVSAVKWCDPGNHAFKASEPGAQSLDIMQRGENGVEERVTMDICGSHAFNTAPSPAPRMREVEQAYESQERKAAAFMANDTRAYLPTYAETRDVTPE